jgi:hypothetical protein
MTGFEETAYNAKILQAIESLLDDIRKRGHHDIADVFVSFFARSGVLIIDFQINMEDMSYKLSFNNSFIDWEHYPDWSPVWGEQLA